MEDSRLETEAQILIQPDSQVRIALRGEHIVERSHFRFIISTGADLNGATVAQLAIRRRPIALRRELRLHAQRIVGVHRLTPIPARRTCFTAWEGIAP